MVNLYLDWAATTPVHSEVLTTQTRVAAETFGNPSSIHQWGKEAKDLLDTSRRICGKLLGAKVDEVFFTSGGSESNNLVFTSFLRKTSQAHAIVPLFEHSSVYEPSRILEQFGWEVSRIPAEKDGRMDPDTVIKAIKKNTAFITLMLVNNETGAIQPVAELIKGVREKEQRPIHVHVDAVQAIGKLGVHFKELGSDSLAGSAHKFRGPRGVGILLLKKPIPSLFAGGGQERGVRPGTENLPGIVGMARALEIAAADREKNFRGAELLMETLLSIFRDCPQCKILPENRLIDRGNYSPYIVSLAFPPVPGEVLVRVLSEKGYGVSTGSACSSRKKRDTRVLEASGVSFPLAFSSIRVSIGPLITKEQMLTFADDLRKEIEILFQVVK